MIAYLDTSALFPLLVQEPTSEACRALWDTADDVASNQITFVECAAALAAARRAHRITHTQHRTCRSWLDDFWREISVVPVDQTIVSVAAELTDAHSLRGYDAVHCASAMAIQDVDLVAAAGDRRLLDAWHDLGVATVDINA